MDMDLSMISPVKRGSDISMESGYSMKATPVVNGKKRRPRWKLNVIKKWQGSYATNPLVPYKKLYRAYVNISDSVKKQSERKK